MKRRLIRATVDLPVSLDRKLKERALAKGTSVRKFILAGVRIAIQETRRPKTKRARFPLIVSEGPKVSLTNEKIYDSIEFPG